MFKQALKKCAKCFDTSFHLFPLRVARKVESVGTPHHKRSLTDCPPERANRGDKRL